MRWGRCRGVLGGGRQRVAASPRPSETPMNTSVYASSLQHAELAIVTMGWIVILQVGLVVVDHVRYAVELPAGKWVAVMVLLAAPAHLLLGPSGVAKATA